MEHIYGMIHRIEKIEAAIMENVTEARHHIECAHKLRDECRMSADWYRDMAVKHMEFNAKGRDVYEMLMRKLAEEPDAAQLFPGVKMAYGSWMNRINEETARVHAMIGMYK